MRMQRSGKSIVHTECFDGAVKSFKVVLKAGTHRRQSVLCALSGHSVPDDLWTKQVHCIEEENNTGALIGQRLPETAGT
jgi:hypothetical protein